MEVERKGDAEDAPDHADKSEAQRDTGRRMPPDRPGEPGQSSRADRFLRKVYGNFGDINDRVEKTSSKIVDLFEPATHRSGGDASQ